VKAEADILIREEGPVGHVTLNRPKALNALTYDMAMAIEAALDRWRDDPAIRLVLIDAAGDRAFCAGGDIQDLYRHGIAGDYEFGRKFWADEYRLNAKIAGYPKPYVALMDGVTMGGGVGVSAHGSHRIVTEKTMLAMPECTIGLVPDVGGTYILARAPGRLGDYLGLTGTRIGAADAILTGFADTYVPSARLADLKAALIASGDVAVIADFSETPPPGVLEALQPEIDSAFDACKPGEVCERLAGRDTEWAVNALKAIRLGSPISIACTSAMIKCARDKKDLKRALQIEYRFVSRCMEHGDFLEGIRAAIIDKDRKPKFLESGIEQVTDAEVRFMLGEPAGGDISL
jgi:Enoyl-CoA hydratase/carnithine racemase